MSLDVLDATWFERVLVIAPHADDEVVGVGGLLASVPASRVRVLVAAMGSYSAAPEMSVERRMEALGGALAELGHKDASVSVFGDQESKLDQVEQAAMCSWIEEHVAEVDPTAVLVPYPSHHQDHRAVYAASMAAFRRLTPKLLAAYEYGYIALSLDHVTWRGAPMYVELDEESMAAKRRALEQYGPWLHGEEGVDSVLKWNRRRGDEVGLSAAEVLWLLRCRL